MRLSRRRLLGTAASAAPLLSMPTIVTAQKAGLEVVVWGTGPRVVLVHGSVSNGPASWSEQRPLGDRWRLEVVNRRGFGRSPAPSVRSDFEEDAQDIVEVLGDGAHLIGQSFGAISALYAAALRPQLIRSLTVCEPPAFRLAKGNPAVDAMIAAQSAIRKDLEPREWLEAFGKTVTSGPGSPPARPLPNPLPPELEKGVRLAIGQRPVWEADVPLDALRRTTFRKLVVSGGHHPAYEAVCDVLTRELMAERATIRGAGHQTPRTGLPFNERIEAFLKSA